MVYTVYYSHIEFRNFLQLIVRNRRKKKFLISEIDIECSSKNFLIFEDSTCRFLINMFLIKKTCIEMTPISRPINKISVREGVPSWKIVCVQGLDKASWKMSICSMRK